MALNLGASVTKLSQFSFGCRHRNSHKNWQIKLGFYVQLSTMSFFLDPKVIAFLALKGFFDMLPVIKTKGKRFVFYV
jgi:hypothetical protein